MDHQPGAVVRHLGHARDRPFEEGHVAVGQGPQQQRGRQPTLHMQVVDEPLHVGGPAGLVDDVDGGSLARADRDLQRRLRRQGVVVDQMVAHLVGDHVHQPLGHAGRQGLAIGDRGQELLGIGEARDRLLQAVLGEDRVVVGAGGAHGRLGPMFHQGGGHGLGQGHARGDGDLADRAGEADDLDQVLIGEHRREAQHGGGHRLHVLGQLHGHVVRHQGRGLQGHRQGPAHQLGGVGGHHPQDLVGDRPILVGQHHLVDAAAELVGGGGAFVDGGAPHQAGDVAIGQRRARGRHRSQSPCPGPKPGPSLIIPN